MMLREPISIIIFVGVLIFLAACAYFTVTIPCPKGNAQPCIGGR